MASTRLYYGSKATGEATNRKPTGWKAGGPTVRAKNQAQALAHFKRTGWAGAAMTPTAAGATTKKTAAPMKAKPKTRGQVRHAMTAKRQTGMRTTATNGAKARAKTAGAVTVQQTIMVPATTVTLEQTAAA